MIAEDSARFSLLRAEHLGPLLRGDERITQLMQDSAHVVKAGRNVIETGSDHIYVYRLLRGWAGRVRALKDGRTQFMLIFLPGDIFGFKSMFMRRQLDSVQAISEVLLERVDYNTLYDAYVNDSDVAMRCTWQVVEEERRLHSWVVSLGQGSAEERLALLLLDFKGRLTLAGALLPSNLSFDMPLTQIQLADHLGITPVHTNRVLKEFRDAGIVTVRGGRVLIADLPALVQRAAPLLDLFERSNEAFVGSPSSGGGSST